MRGIYSYLGYEYSPWDDVEEDNIKTYHECYKNGVRVKMPSEFYNHSPYSFVEFEEFVKYVQTVEVFVQG
jgi:uncharacterized protein YacL (UPF0231 family)